MPNTISQTSDVENRRNRLWQWIKENYDGLQVKFIADCAGRGHEINQGELSGLLKKKSFGEKKARSLEMMADMPKRWLDQRSEAVENTTGTSQSRANETRKPAVPLNKWPFSEKITPAIYYSLKPDEKSEIENLILWKIAMREPPTKQKAPARIVNG